MCWAIYTAFGANVLRRHSPLKTTTWAVVAGTVFLAPFGHRPAGIVGIAGGMEAAIASGALVAAILAILYSGTLAAGVANVVIFHAIKLVGPTRITALQSLVPAMAVVLAAIFLGEPIRPGQIVGGVDHPGRRGDPAAWDTARHGTASSAARRRERRVEGPDGTAPPIRPLRPGEPPLAILVDYDGTIALTDVSDTVMAEHVPGIWEAEAAAYDAGLMGSRRLMTWEMAQVDADPAGAVRDGRGPAPRSGLRAVRPPRAVGAACRSRSCRTGSGSSSGRRSRRSGWGSCRS